MKQRQSTKPLSFPTSRRYDRVVGMTSGQAGELALVDYIPLLRNDSASGQIMVDVDLGRLAKPLMNGVVLEVQAWCVPKAAFPQYNGYADYVHSMNGTSQESLGNPDLEPAPQFFTAVASADIGSDYPLLKTLGMHGVSGWDHNMDLVDAYNLVYNTRLEARSTKLAKRKYFTEDPVASTTVGTAFWPRGPRDAWVPDYERALIIGALELEFSSGSLPIFPLNPEAVTANTTAGLQWSNPSRQGIIEDTLGGSDDDRRIRARFLDEAAVTSLADIDKARQTEAFAKLRQAMAGQDVSGFVSEETVLAELMNGFVVPDDMLQRPFMLDSSQVLFGMSERFSTTSDDLEASISEGRARAALSVNCPKLSSGGYIVVTLSVTPERVEERFADDAFQITDADDYPQALRDALDKEPVEIVTNARVDTAHTDAGGIYGYEPLNNRWNRQFTRLGGKYYTPTAGAGFSEARSSIWLTEVVDPKFTEDHWLANGVDQSVFMDTVVDCWEARVRHDLVVVGQTIFGDALAENNDEYADTLADADEGA